MNSTRYWLANEVTGSIHRETPRFFTHDSRPQTDKAGKLAVLPLKSDSQERTLGHNVGFDRGIYHIKNEIPVADKKY